jgi:hypothetical protein
MYDMGMYTVRQYDHMRYVWIGNHRGKRIISGNSELTPSLSIGAPRCVCGNDYEVNV